MRILFDGGAFQQGISGGILNVAVNFLNASSDVRPDVSFTLLADPLFDEMRPELLAKLKVKPEIVYRPVLRRARSPAKLLTPRLGLQVLVDGEVRPFDDAAERIAVAGETPPRSVEFVSRTARPVDVYAGAHDGRALGFAFSRIEVACDGGVSTYYWDDPRFDAGNHAAEAEHRWSAGHLRLPASMLPTRGPWCIRVVTTLRLHYRPFDGRFDGRLDRIAAETARLVRERDLERLAEEMRGLGIQAYFANHFLPIRLPGLRAFTWAYDIIPVVHPEFFDQDARDNFAEVVRVMQAADAVFCISRFTKDSILRHLPIADERLHVSWIGASPDIHRRSEAAVAALRERYDLPRAYLVCVATIEPRKNHVALVEAYHHLLRAMPEAPDLVVAGMRGWGYDAFFRRITELGLSRRVHHLEHLTDDEVAALYSGAELCVYPSLFEGFGLPVLEAMRCGIPVVTSRATSMEEIVEGGAGLLIDPSAPTAIARAMELVLRNPHRRAALLAAAAERLPLFEWPAVARTVLEIMESRLR